MKLWVDDCFLGSFDRAAAALRKLAEWQDSNANKILYLYEYDGEQYSYADSWDDFLKSNVEQDIEVKIFTATSQTLRLELVDSTREYLSRLCGFIESLAVRFYSDPGQTAWQQLSEFLEGLYFLYRSLEILQGSAFEKEKFDLRLRELLNAIETKDTIAVADLLSYEWSYWLNELRNEINGREN